MPAALLFPLENVGKSTNVGAFIRSGTAFWNGPQSFVPRDADPLYRQGFLCEHGNCIPIPWTILPKDSLARRQLMDTPKNKGFLKQRTMVLKKRFCIH